MTTPQKKRCEPGGEYLAMTEQAQVEHLELAAKIAKEIGPFTMKLLRREDYSGEHREWYEDIRIPRDADIVREVVWATLPPAITDLQARLAASEAREARLSSPPSA